MPAASSHLSRCSCRGRCSPSRRRRRPMCRGSTGVLGCSMCRRRTREMVPYDMHEEIAKVYGWRDSWLAAGGRLVPPDKRTVAMSAQAVSAVLSVQSCFAVFAVIVRSLQSPPFPPWRLFAKNLQISTTLHSGPRQQIWQEPGMLYRWFVASED